MGTLKVRAEIGTSSGRLWPKEFIVDPGCFYTLVSPDIGEELGIKFPVTAPVKNADGLSGDFPLGVAYIRLFGREGAIGVCAAEVETPRLGSTALLALGMVYSEQEEEIQLTGHYPPPV